ncbi:hypothetical protein MPLB_1820024 [Mesorhizobium sp. ORS 3324]|nr:hypothetical protein MPLB_1820024 [Mesorhizobium sp. ORS 3324]
MVFYLAILIGCALRDLVFIVNYSKCHDNIRICSLSYDPAFWHRVPTRRAVLRALRRDVWAAALQRSSRRGALFHRTDGARHRQSSAARRSSDQRGRRQYMARPLCKRNVQEDAPGLHQSTRPRRIGALPRWRLARSESTDARDAAQQTSPLVALRERFERLIELLDPMIDRAQFIDHVMNEFPHPGG